MSYNRLKSLAANVAAIETAVTVHKQRRKATQEEKQVLAQYSGFGGVKEVLTIGTQIPMPEELAEQTNRLQEVLRTLAGGSEGDYDLLMNSIKASVLTAFYTPDFLIEAVAGQIHTTFRENGLQMRSFLEPSAGIGGFLPVAMGGTHSYAIEKDIITGLVLSLLYDEATTVTGGFEAIDRQELEHRKFDVIASNIPFGNFRVFDTEFWKKGGEDVVLDMYVASRPAQVPQQGFELRLPIGKYFEATAIEQRGTVVVAQQRRQRLVLRRQVAGILQDTLGVRPLHDAFVGTARDDALLAVVLPEEEVEQQPDTRRKEHRHHPRYRLQRVAVLGNDDYAQAQYRYHVEQKEDGTEYPLQTYQTEHLLLSYVL